MSTRPSSWERRHPRAHAPLDWRDVLGRDHPRAGWLDDQEIERRRDAGLWTGDGARVLDDTEETNDA